VILVDSSVWIEFFRPQNFVDLETRVDLDQIVTCLPVIQEVLQGFRTEGAWLRARDAMYAMDVVESPLRLEVFEEAASLYRLARRAGLTIRSSTDCLIAACAIRHDLEVLHVDRDFTALARISGLRQRQA
jgi:predicted nucleic acid-binding protein